MTEKKLMFCRRGALFFAGACSLAGPIGGGYCPTWYASCCFLMSYSTPYFHMLSPLTITKAMVALLPPNSRSWHWCKIISVSSEL